MQSTPTRCPVCRSAHIELIEQQADHPAMPDTILIDCRNCGQTVDIRDIDTIDAMLYQK